MKYLIIALALLIANPAFAAKPIIDPDELRVTFLDGFRQGCIKDVSRTLSADKTNEICACAVNSMDRGLSDDDMAEMAYGLMMGRDDEVKKDLEPLLLRTYKRCIKK